MAAVARRAWVLAIGLPLAAGCGATSPGRPSPPPVDSGAPALTVGGNMSPPDADAAGVLDAAPVADAAGILDAAPAFDAAARADASNDAGAAANPCAGRHDPLSDPPPPPFVCLPPAAARRMVFPLSGLTVTSARPQLRWVQPDAGSTDVQICADRSCSHPWLTMEAPTPPLTPGAELPAGYWFWRVRPHGADDTSWTAPWLFRVRRRFAGYRPIANTAAEPFADYNGDGVPDAPGGTDYNGDGYTDAGGGLRYVTAACSYDDDRISDVSFGGPGGIGAPAFSFSIEKGWDPLWVEASSGLGDLDGDGYGEMLGFMRYGAYLVRGCGGTPPTQAEILNIVCGNCQLKAAKPGDFDGDQLTDFLYLTGSGAPVLFGGPDTTRLGGVSVSPGSGNVLDVNGDGYSDVVGVDMHGSGQQLSVWLGGAQGLQATASPWPMPVSTAYFGYGDFDGDGYWDGISDTGVVYGGPSPRTATSPSASGSSSVTIVDVNADDFDDVRIGDTWYFGSPQGLAPSH